MSALYVASAVTGYAVAPLGRHAPSAATAVPFVGTVLHNLRVIAILSCGGVGLLMPTLIGGAWNGFLAGSLIAAVAGSSSWLAAILAHGVLEAIGQVCAMVAGAEVCRALVLWLRRGDGRVPWLAAKWLGAAVAFTCVAALVESTLSPFIVSAVFR